VSVSRVKMILNGDHYEKFMYFKCDVCGVELPESSPISHAMGKDFCGECSFKLGLMTESVYLKGFCFWCLETRAEINPGTGEIELSSSKFSWEKKDSDYRHATQYIMWRSSVFARDFYTCLDCGKVGGELEAHHIKSFKMYPKLRFDINNGITLCKKCHKRRHKKGVGGSDG